MAQVAPDEAPAESGPVMVMAVEPDGYPDTMVANPGPATYPEEPERPVTPPRHPSHPPTPPPPTHPTPPDPNPAGGLEAPFEEL